MKIAPVSDNEGARLRALNDYKILDTVSELAYDQLTALASSICGTPVALVSLVDKERQWFKSHHGIDAIETPREWAFCDHAIGQEQVFEVSDSRLDERFHDNPLVTGATKVIFYAGAPLVTPEGLSIGTLCVIDNKPAQLSEQQKFQLTILAKQVVNLLELAKANRLREGVLENLLSVSKSLDQKNKELEQFVYAVSHDLKSPLVTISGFVTMLAKELSAHTSDKQKHRFERINHNVEHMADLLSDLLNLSRVLNKDIDKQQLDTHALVLEQWQGLAYLVKNIDVNFIVAPDLHHINANETLFSQCVSNMLSNAIRYRNLEIPLRIEIRSYTYEGYICISINDNGIGIKPGEHERIFKVFEQLNSGEGSGIGLCIVKAAMEKHNGHIKLVSTEGQGSRFELHFPCDIKQ